MSDGNGHNGSDGSGDRLSHNPSRNGNSEYKVGYKHPPLETRIQPGEVRNPKGRPSGGASVKEWMNVMTDWPRSKIKEVLGNDALPVSQIIAARNIYHASCQALSSSGAPIAGPDFERFMDYTIGKPRQSVDVSMDASVTHKEQTQEAMGRLLTDPESLSALETVTNRIESHGTDDSAT